MVTAAHATLARSCTDVQRSKKRGALRLGGPRYRRIPGAAARTSPRRRETISNATSPAQPSTTGAASPASTQERALAVARQCRPCSSSSPASRRQGVEPRLRTLGGAHPLIGRRRRRVAWKAHHEVPGRSGREGQRRPSRPCAWRAPRRPRAPRTATSAVVRARDASSRSSRVPLAPRLLHGRRSPPGSDRTLVGPVPPGDQKRVLEAYSASSGAFRSVRGRGYPLPARVGSGVRERAIIGRECGGLGRDSVPISHPALRWRRGIQPWP